MLGGGDPLLLLELVHSGELIAEASGGFELLGCCCGDHARGEPAFQLGVTSFEKELRIADSLLIQIRRSEFLDARAQAPMDVVLQTCAGVIAGEINFAAW